MSQEPVNELTEKIRSLRSAIGIGGGGLRTQLMGQVQQYQQQPPPQQQKQPPQPQQVNGSAQMSNPLLNVLTARILSRHDQVSSLKSSLATQIQNKNQQQQQPPQPQRGSDEIPRLSGEPDVLTGPKTKQYRSFR